MSEAEYRRLHCLKWSDICGQIKKGKTNIQKLEEDLVRYYYEHSICSFIPINNSYACDYCDEKCRTCRLDQRLVKACRKKILFLRVVHRRMDLKMFLFKLMGRCKC